MMIMCHIFSYDLETWFFNICQHLVNYFGTLGGMLFHFFKFLRSKSSRLPEHRIINRNLSKVMHRCSLDNIFAKFIIKSFHVILSHLIDKYSYNLARSLDMSAGICIAIFNHICYSKHHLVLNFLYMLCFLSNLMFQPLIILLQKFGIFSFLCFINYGNLITLNLLLIHEMLDNYPIDFAVSFKDMLVLMMFMLMFIGIVMHILVIMFISAVVDTFALKIIYEAMKYGND